MLKVLFKATKEMIINKIPETNAMHPINFLLNKGLPISISTDDPPFFSTSLSKEYQDLHNVFGWGFEIFSQINKRSVEFAFCEAKLKEKLIQQL